MVDVARGTVTPTWPLPGVKPHFPRPSRQFGASRGDGTRHHAGVDLSARAGDIVVATEAGVVVAHQRFNGPQAHAMLVQTDTGPVVLYGEVYRESMKRIGARVEAGWHIANVGVNPGGSSMLHLETYIEGTRRNERWVSGQEPPMSLLDPSGYIRRMRTTTDTTKDPTNTTDPTTELPKTGGGGGLGLSLPAILLVLAIHWENR